MSKVLIRSLKETEKFAKKFAKLLVGGEVILLSGDLGAGKTTFTKYVLKALGVKNEVTSPTFTIMKEYNGKKFDIFHFDMYRIGSGDEAREFGLEDYIYSKNGRNLVFIEWSENIKDILFGNFIRINITLNEQGDRFFDIEKEVR